MHARAESVEGSPQEGRGAFAGFIGPRTLVQEVKSAAPFLFDGLFDGSHPDAGRLPRSVAEGGRERRLCELGHHPLGWWSILRASDQLEARPDPTPAERTDYFALCLAAHFATVATYVPTDVDAKIRGALWFDQRDPSELERMRDLALDIRAWDLRPVSARIVEVQELGPVSGHDGERLSVWCGGMLGLLAAGDAAGAARFEAEIDTELTREAQSFAAVEREPGREMELLRLAAILTHNAGDVVQGLSGKSAREFGAREKQRFADLARERFERYGGAFGRAAALYRAILAPEGHRHYPLRTTKLLRAHKDLLLPIGPFLDDWGARLATWPSWGAKERAEVVSAIVVGCRKVVGQESYYRALAGFDGAHRGGIEADELLAHCGTAVRRGLKDPEMRRKVSVPRISFERSLAKRTRAALLTPLA